MEDENEFNEEDVMLEENKKKVEKKSKLSPFAKELKEYAEFD